MLESYQGSCHCGCVRFEVSTDISQGAVCDCSICRRRGAVMVRCEEKDLTILQGGDSLTCYPFNTQAAQHYFCKVCGIYTFHKMRKFPEKFGVNTGCLEGVDAHRLSPAFIEGSKR